MLFSQLKIKFGGQASKIVLRAAGEQDASTSRSRRVKALYFDGKKLTERRLPKPRPGRRDAVVKIRMAGICSTDLEIMLGYMNFRGVPGHEFVGTVESASPRSLVGKRVVGEINVPCGKCRYCRMGLGKHCRKRSVLGIDKRNGAFAEYMSIPVENLHIVPKGLSDEEAVFAEPLAAACEIPARTAIPAESSVAVLGDGRLAALAAQVLSLKTSNVKVLGINREKLSKIRRTGIAALDISRRDRPGMKFDMVVECTGLPTGLPVAARLVRPQGTIVLKSTYHGMLKWNPAPIVIDEITVTGSRCGPFDTALRLLALSEVEVLPFLTAVYPFEEWKKAFRRARSTDSFKVALMIS